MLFDLPGWLARTTGAPFARYSALIVGGFIHPDGLVLMTCIAFAYLQHLRPARHRLPGPENDVMSSFWTATIDKPYQPPS